MKKIKNIITAFCLLAITLSFTSDKGSHLQWLTNFESSKTNAMKANKIILLSFQGSGFRLVLKLSKT